MCTKVVQTCVNFYETCILLCSSFLWQIRFYKSHWFSFSRSHTFPRFMSLILSLNVCIKPFAVMHHSVLILWLVSSFCLTDSHTYMLLSNYASEFLHPKLSMYICVLMSTMYCRYLRMNPSSLYYQCKLKTPARMW